MARKWTFAAILVTSAALLASCVLFGQGKQGEREHKVGQKEVPAAALAALQKLAGGSEITEFAEEVEHGHTFYEGSWKGPHGNIDGLVTPKGDLVELEESIPAGMAPSAVRDEAKEMAGEGSSMSFEKKTMVLYEVHFKKDGHWHEQVFTPDGRRYVEGGAKKRDHDEDDEEGEEEGD